MVSIMPGILRGGAGTEAAAPGRLRASSEPPDARMTPFLASPPLLSCPVREEGLVQTSDYGPGRQQSFTPLQSDSGEQLVFESVEQRSGIDYALRTIQQSQVQFSLMADAKANIMITVCSIVISVSITQLYRPEFLRPLLTLDLFTAVALISALLCVLPSRRKPPLRNGVVDVDSPTFNPLFFMHFRYLSPEEFEKQLEQRFSSAGELYRSLSRDIYAGGVVLASSKFRLLQISYVSFIVGLLAALAVAMGELLIW
jgi:hypothetical protein